MNRPALEYWLDEVAGKGEVCSCESCVTTRERETNRPPVRGEIAACRQNDAKAIAAITPTRRASTPRGSEAR